MIGMAISDLCNSLAWMIGALAVPEYDDGDPSGVPNAHGNEASCIASAVVLHIGYGCFWYNVSLTTYYKFLYLVNHWHEAKLQKIRRVLVYLPALIALIMSLVGIPYYTWLPFGCTDSVFPLEDHLFEVLFFFMLPIGFAAACMTSMMVKIYCEVRRSVRQVVQKETESVRIGATFTLSGERPDLETKAFWQAIYYLFG
jgi:hypothetical protein